MDPARRPTPRASLSIAMIGSIRFSDGPPFAGGLEAFTWQLAEQLAARGHDVTVFGNQAPRGCGRRPVAACWRPSDAARADVSNAPDVVVADHHGYLEIVRTLAHTDGFDVVHNNSTHYLPLASAALYRAPQLTTLHTPPTPWLESALRISGRDAGALVSVSASNAAAWAEATGSHPAVIGNGVDCDLWHPAPGRKDGAVWMGRIVPEKAPHLAVEAARAAGLDLRLAGPIHDRTYFDEEVRPRLGRGIEYHGHLGPQDGASLVAGAAVCLVTPTWPEPFGLVVAESLACGTPVAGFAVGALPELVDDTLGRLAPPGDVVALADATVAATALDRNAIRRLAVERFDLDRMADDYEREFLAL